MLGGRGGGLLPSGPSCDAKPAKDKKENHFYEKKHLHIQSVQVEEMAKN